MKVLCRSCIVSGQVSIGGHHKEPKVHLAVTQEVAAVWLAGFARCRRMARLLSGHEMALRDRFAASSALFLNN